MDLSSEVGLRLLFSPISSHIVVRTACCTVGTVLPVYSTFKAIENNDQNEQRKWLLYWTVYGSFTVAEVLSDKILSWCPFYYHAKFAFLLWLQLPSASGAKHLYMSHLRPFLLRHQSTLDQMLEYIYNGMVLSTKCEPLERLNELKTEYAAASKKNAELRQQVKELTEKLRLAEQGKDHAQKQVEALGKQHKAGPFGTVKGLKINPTVIPDESVNPRLAIILENVAVERELIVALANWNVKGSLEVWFINIKRVGIPNYLVVALDDKIVKFCESNDVPVYKRDADEGIDSVGRTGLNHAVSGLKFRILREFLQLGYSVLLSDVDIVYLQNPFNYLYRDSDVESMTDGHDNMTAYGYDDVFDEPTMGWARYAHTMRLWVYNCGFFYVRPTIPSIELLDRVASRLAREPKSWDQAVFNEELFFPSHHGYSGLHAARRTMDFYLFMNSKVLFKTVRKDARLSKFKPVIIHVNYHPNKLERMKAIVEFYVNGKQDALKAFPDGSDW